MNSGITKKVIFFYFLFFIFIQKGVFAKLNKIKNTDNILLTQESLLKKINFKKSTNLLVDNFKIIPSERNFSKKRLVGFLNENREKQQELVIQSDKQSEKENIFYAEGNVIASYKGKLLKADSLIYDKLNKRISAKGNIALLLGDQFFLVSELEYSFINEKGYLLDVKGFINTNTLINDLSSNFSTSDFAKIESLTK